MIKIKTQRIGPVTLMQVHGRMDSTARHVMMDALERELARDKHQIILNLAEVEYISTSGLKMLRRLYEETGTVRIAHPSDRVRDVLQMTGLDTTYGIYDSQSQAIHAVTPIVNAHTHLEQGYMADELPGVVGRDFTDWLYNAVSKRNVALGETRLKISRAAAERGIQALIDSGTTMVGDISGTGASIEPLLDSGLRGTVYVETSGYTPERAQIKFEAARALIDRWRSRAHGDIQIGFAFHTPYSVSQAFWPQLIDYARREALPLSIHAAESPAEYELFTKGTGPIHDYMRSVGSDFKPPMKSPIAYLDEIGVLDLKPMLVHCVQVDNEDIRRIKRAGCAVTHCPRSNVRLRCGRMPLEKFLVAGVPVYLGTDSLGSSPSLNVLDEMEFAIALHYGHVPPEQVAALAHQPF
ncbi:MAG: amidohydrolase family protein [bacterium]|nr:amidohydrolase family protein [bacterium]